MIRHLCHPRFPRLLHVKRVGERGRDEVTAQNFFPMCRFNDDTLKTSETAQNSGIFVKHYIEWDKAKTARTLTLTLKQNQQWTLMTNIRSESIFQKKALQEKRFSSSRVWGVWSESNTRKPTRWKSHFLFANPI